MIHTHSFTFGCESQPSSLNWFKMRKTCVQPLHNPPYVFSSQIIYLFKEHLHELNSYSRHFYNSLESFITKSGLWQLSKNSVLSNSLNRDMEAALFLWHRCHPKLQIQQGQEDGVIALLQKVLTQGWERISRETNNAVGWWLAWGGSSQPAVLHIHLFYLVFVWSVS